LLVPSDWCGIDPGLDGCILFGVGADMITFYDMPVVTAASGKRSVDGPMIYDILKYERPSIVGLELLRPRPKGAVAAFKLGQAMEGAHVAAHASGAVVKLLAPQDWKSEWGFAVGDKDDPRQRLLHTNYPDAEWLRFKYHQDRADAYWIGRTADLRRNQ
jgi:hypothetical protein